MIRPGYKAAVQVPWLTATITSVPCTAAKETSPRAADIEGVIQCVRNDTGYTSLDTPQMVGGLKTLFEGPKSIGSLRVIGLKEDLLYFP